MALMGLDVNVIEGTAKAKENKVYQDRYGDTRSNNGTAPTSDSDYEDIFCSGVVFPLSDDNNNNNVADEHVNSQEGKAADGCQPVMILIFGWKKHLYITLILCIKIHKYPTGAVYYAAIMHKNAKYSTGLYIML
ncbi:hypothetical protein M378DRAFT_751622 [Amanita muscaria Koide BX008]|uniref:Uncharacterized protein n=1 Tax=Amanita muscaria (strain Koide BX008) TaxID=946122 RepID=A0A0C2X0H1_AMAMK|nr:hypothetical protein M378DRAFT_751622 [Amanita muscaria Koide BX008]